MEPEELQNRLVSFPRLRLANYPTPLEKLVNLSKDEGYQIFVKRDDTIGPGLGGNKTRKLEYLLADAQIKGARKLVTFGGLQSNHTRITTAAGRALGMQVDLFFFERRPKQLSGNLFLSHLMGATLHFIPLGSGAGGLSLESVIRLVHWVAWLRVGAHYYIPVGGHTWLGCLGYVNAAIEIDRQAREIGIDDAQIVLAAGSGGTLAGLMAGFELIGSQLRLLGIDVGKLWKGFPNSIARLASEICSKLGEQHVFTSQQAPLIEAKYVGEKYGAPSREGLSALRHVAQREGLLLDPVYTAKAFAGLLDQCRTHKLNPNKAVIFLHTGGIPAVFNHNAVQLITG